MTVVLGIDAAWTPHEPSGVALVAKRTGRWRLLCVAPSYASFLDHAEGVPVDWTAGRFQGDNPDIGKLLPAAAKIAGKDVDVVSVDMPVSTVPFSGRRVADNAISRAFGGRGCSAHSPNAERPGRLGHNLMSQLDAAGYPLSTAVDYPGTEHRTVEVYPHPALLALLGRDYRVPYKVSKSRTYWHSEDLPTRIVHLINVFREIEAALNSMFGDTGLRIPSSAAVDQLSKLKRHEDAIDGLLCAWIATKYIEGAATPYGDNTAAIWVPCT